MKLFFPFLMLFFSSFAFGDQAATLTCTGRNIVLEEIRPYLGENSKFSQSLFILKSKEDKDESSYLAYFLDISYDIGRGGIIYISEKNEVAGKFDLITSFPQNISDGTTIKEISKGTITYSHGPLKGKDTVNCIRE